MEPYKKMYTLLFNAVTDSLEEMKKANYGLAAENLRKAQLMAEAIFIDSVPDKSRKKRNKFLGCGF